jgi:hypothetical protein
VLPFTGIGSPVLSKWSIPCHNMFRNENKYAITLVLFIFVPNCVLAVAESSYICSYQKNIHVSEATMQLKYEYRSIHSLIHSILTLDCWLRHPFCTLLISILTPQRSTQGRDYQE